MVDLEQQWLQQARHATFEDYRRQHVSAWIAPRGTSMRPLIGPDTWLLVEFGATEIRPGDIILFPQRDILVAHRVVALRRSDGRTTLIPKGDAEPFSDPHVRPDDVIGVVRALREGRDGRAFGTGCGGASARTAAGISRWLGRGARLAHRAATLLPDPLRRSALRAIPPSLRVAARILLTPLHWAAWIDSSTNKGRG
ncbi:MAG: hypothetical protein IPO81_04825 [Kouleothrix sp.]|nr:hypothetical protein [Kouleothrix sp.]